MAQSIDDVMFRQQNRKNLVPPKEKPDHDHVRNQTRVRLVTTPMLVAWFQYLTTGVEDFFRERPCWAFLEWKSSCQLMEEIQTRPRPPNTPEA